MAISKPNDRRPSDSKSNDTKAERTSDTQPELQEATALDMEKANLDHIERAGSEGALPVKKFINYEDMAPIYALNLPDWRATERALVKRLDCVLLPTLWLLYFNNYLDRTNIAQARLAEPSIDDALDLGSNGYQLAVSLLTIGYMIGQLPSNMLLTRVRPGMYLPGTVLIWSGVSIATAFATNRNELWAIRFILGLVEAPLFPGAVYLMSCWYTRKEIALRTSILYSGLVLAQAFSGILAAGIFSGLGGAAGIDGWQWLFIVEALMSIVCGIGAFWTLPDYPHSKTGSQTWLMTQDMRDLAVARIRADRVTGSADRGSVLGGVMLNVKDVKFYLFALLNLTMTASYGFNFFFPTLVRGLDIGDNTTSLLLTAPPYFLGAFVSFIVAWNSDRIKERGYHISGGLLASAIGFIITIATTAMPARYFASFLYAPGSFSSNALVYSWAVSSLGATPEKRAAAGAMVNIVGHVGNVISPYFFLESQNPEYQTAFILMLVFGALAFAAAMSTKIWLKLSNRKLRAAADAEGHIYNPYTL